MRILIIDGQGGGVGCSIAQQLCAHGLTAQLRVVGANAVATANMMKAGVLIGATGENAVCFNCAEADLIVGPIGILLPNAMYGEISPVMAHAVAESPARKILVPVTSGQVQVVGLREAPLSDYVQLAVQAVLKALGTA